MFDKGGGKPKAAMFGSGEKPRWTLGLNKPTMNDN